MLQNFPQDLLDLTKEYETKCCANLAKYKPPIYLKLVECTSFLPLSATIKQRFYHVINDLTSIPKCPQCSVNDLKWHATYKPHARYSTYCSRECAANSEGIKTKRKQTCIKKYGVESFSQTQQFKDKPVLTNASKEQATIKRKATMLQKYGSETSGQCEVLKEKRKQTCLERYGHTNVLASQHVKDIRINKYGVSNFVNHPSFEAKREQTMLRKYGVKYSGQSEELIAKRKQTCLERYGDESWSRSHVSRDCIDKLNDKLWLYDMHIIRQTPITHIALLLGVDKETVSNYLSLHGVEKERFTKSYAEQELCNFFTQHNIQCIFNDRKILNGKELDIIIPSHKIAIEYCGLYWHSTAFERNTPQYHKNKLDGCRREGYRLITIFEDEWVHNKQLVKDKLLYVLGCSSLPTAHGRKCSVIEVNSDLKNNFFDTYHIQGTGPGSITYGLQYQDQLVAVMTFIDKGDGVYVLNRYATSCKVVGGFSKLLRYFQNNHTWKQIISFADLRWSDGKLYETNGFVLDKILPPDYCYVDLTNIKTIHKFNFRHKNLPKILGDKYDPELSETQNTHNNNWFRIYNCGLMRFVVNQSS